MALTAQRPTTNAASGLARRFGSALLALAFDLLLLGPLLISFSLVSGQTKRVYFEPLGGGVDLLLDEQQAGYMTEIEVDDDGNLAIPTGRTIAVALPPGERIVVRTDAVDLAPYVVLGVEEALPDEVDGDRFARVARFAAATVLDLEGGALVSRPWDPTRPWARDRAWLSELRERCGPGPSDVVSLRAEAQGLALRLGDCELMLPAAAPRRQLLMVVSGLHGAVLSRTGDAWEEDAAVSRELVVVALLHVLLLSVAIGAAPTALFSATLFAAGLLLRPAAILVWFLTLPVAALAAVWQVARRWAPRRPALAWASAALLLVVELGVCVAALALFEVGSFGKERFTRAGDDTCSVVGYSTVRGDSLREGSEGLVERLGAACGRCRQRTSRFSREAQTLRWVREVVCAPSFPTPAGREVIFFGGGNDDVFYRPGGVLRVLGVLLNLLRYSMQPVDAMDWEGAFAPANEIALTTLDEQRDDIEASVRCAREGGGRFWFVHDFLLWDLGRGRTPTRQKTFAARRAAVAAAGGEFIDLYEEFGSTASLTWFNDWIHPSGYGQRMVADLLCERLEAP